jgi:hypothetical protein
MKKLLAGCLVVLVLGAVTVAVGTYFLYRAASPYIQDARSYLEGMSQLDDLEQKITLKTSYTAPPSGELTQAQVERFVRVQQHVRTQLGQRFSEIEKKYEYLRSNDAQPSITELLGSLREMTGIVVDARRYQVDALNKEQFSQDEFSWVRDQVFRAAGVEFGSRIDLSKIQEAIRSGTGIEDINTDRLPLGEIPARNRALVKPYVERMDEWLPLVFFGL